MSSYSTRLRAAREAAGKCRDCGKDRDEGRKRCAPCNAKLVANNAEFRRRAKAKAETGVPDEQRIVVERITTPLLGRPINAAALRTCPHCGDGDIVTIAQLGDDRLPSCERCAEDVEPVGYPVDVSISMRAIFVARTCQGMTFVEIADHLGVDGMEREAVSSALYRSCRDGVLRRVDGCYFAGKPWRVTEERSAA